MTTYTHSSLSTARACLHKFDMGYNMKLTPNGDEKEYFTVGNAWHAAHDRMGKEGDEAAGYAALYEYAPNRLWNEKLGRLFAAYHWYWRDQPFEVIESEHTFETSLEDINLTGQLDGVIRVDGRKGILERKTTSESVEPDSKYWNRLRMDPQVGIYASAVGFMPSFILYDVVRKPTINPARINKSEVARMRKELDETGKAKYYQEEFSARLITEALAEGRESVELYGARLTSDISDRPGFYFARRPIDRSDQDFKELFKSLEAQVAVIEHAELNGLMYRNADACDNYNSRCEFFGLCANNIDPVATGVIPDGFHVRQHRHPELATNNDD